MSSAETIAPPSGVVADEHVVDESGHFHAHDAPVDLSHYTFEAWIAFVLFWVLAATNATADITKRERELADEFKKKGLTIINPDKKSFQDAIMKSVSLESMGYAKADWDKVQAVK